MARRPSLSRWIVSPALAEQRDIDRPSDQGVERMVRLAVVFVGLGANLVGAVAVFVLAIWVLPTDEVQGEASPILVNLAMAVGYTIIAAPIGVFWALRRLQPARAWLKEDRPPTRAEQMNLLRSPIQVLIVVGTIWLVAALVFGLYNATYSLELAQRVAITVALGGLVTCSIAYLLTERLLRPAAARALAARELEDPALPGLTVRSMFAWGVGSGIPLVGLLLIGLSALIEEDFSRSQLAIAVIGLSGGAILLGFFASLLAARVSAAPIESVRQAMSEIEAGDLDAEVTVYDGTEVGLLQSGFNRMAEGLRERERIRELFGMHVGAGVAKEALERDVELGGETRRVAVLFVDMVGSTEIAATRPANEVVDLLNEFFGIVVEVVDAHGGWVNKFEGDAALAVFGAPEHLSDAPARALAAGRDLADRLEREISDAGAGIGVSYGEAVAGNIGSDQRFEYTVIGDAVNEAARLTELAKSRPGRLLSSAATIDAASEDEASRWTLAETVELRGRAEPTRLALPTASLQRRAGGGPVVTVRPRPASSTPTAPRIRQPAEA